MRSGIVALLGLALCSVDRGFAADGGTDVGNGGDAVVCRAADGTLGGLGTILSAQSLDLFEAIELRQMPISLGSKDISPLDKVMRALKQFERLDPVRSQRYQERAAGFFADANIMDGIVLEDIDDAEPTINKPGCAIEQLAIRRPKRYPQDKTFQISGDIWKKLDDNDSRAMLILHEIIYEEFADAGAKNSLDARYFNSYIASSLTSSDSQENYLELLRTFELFDKFERQGFSFLLSEPLTFFPDGTVNSGTTEGGSLRLRNQTVLLPKGTELIFRTDGSPLSAKAPSSESFTLFDSNNSRVRLAMPIMDNISEQPFTSVFTDEAPYLGKHRAFMARTCDGGRGRVPLSYRARFFDDGVLYAVDVTTNLDKCRYRQTAFKVRTQFSDEIVLESTGVKMFPNGNIESALIYVSGKFQTFDGTFEFMGVGAGNLVSFHDNGRLRKGHLIFKDGLESALFTRTDGTKTLVKHNDIVVFDAEGKVSQVN